MWIFLTWKQMSFVKPCRGFSFFYSFSPSGRSEVRFRTACWAVKKTWSAICAVNHVFFCFFFVFFLRKHLKPAVWVYHSLSSFHSYCSLKFHMLSWVELRGDKHASPLCMIDSETRQSGWAKHASTTAIFTCAPLAAFTKSIFMCILKNIALVFIETAEFRKKKHLYARLRC